MSRLQEIEKLVQELSPEERAEFKQWLEEFEADLWDAQIEADVKAGKLDKLFEQGLADHATGRTREL